MELIQTFKGDTLFIMFDTFFIIEVWLISLNNLSFDMGELLSVKQHGKDFAPSVKSGTNSTADL